MAPPSGVGGLPSLGVAGALGMGGPDPAFGVCGGILVALSPGVEPVGGLPSTGKNLLSFGDPGPPLTLGPWASPPCS